MDEIKTMPLNIQEEIRQQMVEMLNIKEGIKNTSNINEKFKSLENKNLLMEQKLNTKKAIDIDRPTKI
ncbi:unnamed protein product, partial [Brenthis ino]